MALLQLCVHGAAASDDLAFAPYTDLKIDTFSTATLPSGGAMHYYRMWLSSQQSSVKVILLPLKGDADALVSFDRNATAQRSVGGHGAASWRLQGHGVEELLLRPEVLCRLAPTANNEEPAPPACYLYARVRGYYDEGTTYMFGVLDARNAFSVGVACAPGCGAERLSNLVCDAACNVTACAYDRGACVPQLAAACSPGCQREWLADGECDDACFTETCTWDEGDCAAIDIDGCASACFSDYIDDGECDGACNVAECKWDGRDCDHGHAECYEHPRGDDYRGSINVTVSGRPCQKWSSQFPQQHFFTHARYPNAGLGAHSACRNPSSLNEGPWCYTADHRLRWERCDVGSPALTGPRRRSNLTIPGP